MDSTTGSITVSPVSLHLLDLPSFTLQPRFSPDSFYSFSCTFLYCSSSPSSHYFHYYNYIPDPSSLHSLYLTSGFYSFVNLEISLCFSDSLSARNALEIHIQDSRFIFTTKIDSYNYTDIIRKDHLGLYVDHVLTTLLKEFSEQLQAGCPLLRRPTVTVQSTFQ